MKVKLTYFKESGKYYSGGALEVPDDLPHDIGGLKAGEVTPMFEIWDVVRHLLITRSLPGLVPKHSPYQVLVEVPEHPHNCPHMVFEGAFPDTWGEHFEYHEVPE